MKLHIDIYPEVRAENYSVFGGLLSDATLVTLLVDNKENIEKKKTFCWLCFISMNIHKTWQSNNKYVLALIRRKPQSYGITLLY